MGNPQASPGPVVINEKNYLMSPLTDKAIGELNNNIRKEIIGLARDNIEEDTPAHVVDSMMKVAMETARNVDWTQDPEKWLNAKHLMYMFYLCLRPNHPKLTYEELASEIAADQACLDGLYDTFAIVQPTMMGNQQRARTPNQATKKKHQQKKRSTKR